MMGAMLKCLLVLSIAVHTFAVMNRWVYSLPPKDRTLYDILEISPDASRDEIRKAYLKLALKFHPDKGSSDEEEFKRIADAYQILSNENSRANYHTCGFNDVFSLEGSSNSAKTWNTIEVYRLFLGGKKFKFLIGELFGSANVGEETDAEKESDDQWVDIMSLHLLEKLNRYVFGDEIGFEREAYSEAAELIEESYGREMLSAVGYIYENYGRRTVGKLSRNRLNSSAFLGRFCYYSERASYIKKFAEAVSSSAGLMLTSAAKERYRSELQSGKPHQTSSFTSVDDVEDIGRVLWKVQRLTVEERIRKVCRRVLRDERVHPSVLRQRALATVRLGQIFRKVASLPSDSAAGSA